MNMKTFKAYSAIISEIENGRRDAVRKFLETMPESMKANMPEHVREAFGTIFEQAFNAGASVASAAILKAMSLETMETRATSRQTEPEVSL